MMWFIYTVEYYSAIIKNEIKPLVATWADPEIMLSEVSQKKINIWHYLKMVLVDQLHLTLYNTLDCSLPGFSAHRMLQARILEWVAIPFSRGSSWPRDQTWASSTAGRFFMVWVTRKSQIYMRSLKNDANELIYKNRNRLTNLCLPKGKGRKEG